MKEYFSGIVLIVIGITGYLKGGGILYGITVPAEQGGFVFFSLGVLLMLQTFLKKRANSKRAEFVICEKCKEKYKAEYVQISACPKCNGKLVAYKETINSDIDKQES